MSILLRCHTGSDHIRVEEHQDKSKMSDTQVVKFEIGAKYILIVKERLNEDQKERIIRAIDNFVHDDNIQVMIISDVDCILEKIAESDLD